MWLSLCPSVPLSFCPSVLLSLCPSVPLSLSPSVPMYRCPSGHLSLCHYVPPELAAVHYLLCRAVPLSLSFCPSAPLSLCHSVQLSFWPSCSVILALRVDIVCPAATLRLQLTFICCVCPFSLCPEGESGQRDSFSHILTSFSPSVRLIHH